MEANVISKSSDTGLKTEPARKLKNAVWPFSLPYLAWPLRCEFISDFMDDFSALDDTTIIARDGLVPLLWFFRHYPDPAKVRFKILVHASMADYVPEAWRPFTGSYKVETQFPEADVPPTELLLCGLTWNLHCSLESLESRIARLRAGFSPREWTVLKKSVFVPLRTDIRPAGIVSFETAFLMDLGRHLQTPVEAVDWYGLEARDSFQDALFVDLNDGWLCADSYLRHLVLSRGGREFAAVAADTAGAPAERLELSQSHALVIQRSLSPDAGWVSPWGPDFAREYEDYYRRIQTLARKSESDDIFPWPPWFEGWCMTVYGKAGRHVP